MAIQNIIKSVQNIMRKDAGVDGDAQRLSQLVWMLFLKIFEELEPGRNLNIFDILFQTEIYFFLNICLF